MADKEWTVMLFFAVDNALSPLIVSQIKALKDAGFHEDVDVLVHFDSNEAGVPTRVLDINRKRKKRKRLMIGDGSDPYVRDMKDDIVTPDDLDPDFETWSGKLHASLKNSDTCSAAESLRIFLGYCRDKHPAKNYMLFLAGHGIIVGKDTFLPDDKPASSITLPGLRDILEGFNDGVGTLQLLGLHSCAMSAIEVAYQLKGTAKYMLGTEGVAYIDSWPYRQLMKKLFLSVERAKGGKRRLGKDRAWVDEEEAKDPDDPDVRVQRLVEQLYFLSLFNGTDFMAAGYSLDLCLCNLNEENFEPLTESIRSLVVQLKRALESDQGQELIILAHWESQSYWDERYTDLFDFCRCLRKRCSLALDRLKKYADPEKSEEVRVEMSQLTKLEGTCTDLIKQLAWKRSKDLADRFSKLIVHSCHFGSKYQYSHGLSVYFPWSRPLDDDPPPSVYAPLRAQQRVPRVRAAEVMKRYLDYAFNAELEAKAKGESWHAFLESYFEKTMRAMRVVEQEQDKKYGEEGDEEGPIYFTGFVDPLGGMSGNAFSALDSGKPTPATGESCACPSIKNYPTQTVDTPSGELKVRAITASKIVVKKALR